jgi:hypothetical protein
VQQAASGIDRRNLRGRCGGFRFGSESFRPETRRAVSGACFVRGRRRSNEAVKEARTPRLQSYPPIGKERRDEGTTLGDLRSERASARHAPGSLGVESILIAATALLFAGEAETGI